MSFCFGPITASACNGIVCLVSRINDEAKVYFLWSNSLQSQQNRSEDTPPVVWPDDGRAPSAYQGQESESRATIPPIRGGHGRSHRFHSDGRPRSLRDHIYPAENFPRFPEGLFWEEALRLKTGGSPVTAPVLPFRAAGMEECCCLLAADESMRALGFD